MTNASCELTPSLDEGDAARCDAVNRGGLAAGDRTHRLSRSTRRCDRQLTVNAPLWLAPTLCHCA